MYTINDPTMVDKSGIRKRLSLLVILWLLTSTSVCIINVLAGQSYNGLLLTTDTQNLKPGQLNKVKFTLKNTGNLDLKSLILTINMPSSQQQSEAPMYIVNGDGRHYIDEINTGQTLSITENIFVNPKSANSMYLIKIEIYYTAGGEYVDTRSIGFTIDSLTETGAIIDVSTSTNTIISGKNTTVLLILNNLGDLEAINVEVSMTLPSGGASSPLTLRNSDGNWVIDRLGKNQTTTIPLEMFAAPSSAGNVYMITLSIKYADSISQKQISRYISIGVPYPKSQGAILNAKLDDQNLASGSTNSRILTITNTGDDRAWNILVTLKTPNTQSIALIGTSGPWNIAGIEPGKSYDIPVKFFITTAATGATYNIPVTVSYVDSDYRQKQDTYEIGVVVFGSVAVTALDSSTYPAKITPGKTFSITSTIINLGTTTAQSVIITPKTNPYMKPFSNSTMFIGDLSVNVPSSITMTYIAADVKNQTYPIEVEYSYRLSTSQTYSEKITIPVRITVLSQTEQAGTTTPQPQQQTNPLIQYLPIPSFVGIALVVAYIILARRRAK
jgi:hypothetical protein